jgi:hypothetical protein
MEFPARHRIKLPGYISRPLVRVMGSLQIANAVELNRIRLPVLHKLSRKPLRFRGRE